MASIRKLGTSWRAYIFKLGVRDSKVFKTKAEAAAWAAARESEIVSGKTAKAPNKTFAAALTRYAEEVSSTKRGERWEVIRLAKLAQDELGQVKLANLAQPHFAAWRDRRLAQVSAASVRREWGLLSNVCTVAVNEWHWLPAHPMKGIKKPAAPAARTRRISQAEIDALAQAAGVTDGASCTTATARVYLAFLFAIETGMRCAEICRLTVADISGKVASVGQSKTAAGVRQVPLSDAALAIIRRADAPGPTIFGLKPGQVDALFRKTRAKACIEDLHFHDTRHEAISRLAKRLDVLSLARVVGHQDLRMLMVYYNPTAAELAPLLD